MSLNYKNVALKNLNQSTDTDGFVEVKKNNKKNQTQIVSLQSPSQSYDKEHIQEIIHDLFDLEYSNSIIDAQIEFENQIENDFYLKTKHVILCENKNKSKRLCDIIKYHSAHYYKIKQDVHKNKSKYL
jgi:hypothetical protein